jgi:hypothetical protein
LIDLILMSHLFYSFLYHDESELILIHRGPLRIDGRHETSKPNYWLWATPHIILILYYVLQIHYLISSNSTLTIDLISFCNHLVSSAPSQNQKGQKGTGAADAHRY